jgi:SAM-dependent methyltransferase
VGRTAAALVGPRGAVVGVDLNEAMLDVARRIAPGLAWRRGSADALPAEDAGFDAVTCQMAMMFFPERTAAFAEMARVARPGGRVVVVVPAALEVQPAYRALVEVAAEHSGPEARTMLGAYWTCGDLDGLASRAEAGGLTVIDRSTVPGTARFDSAEDFVRTEIAGSPLAEIISDPQATAMCAEVARRIPQYDRDGRFDIPLLGHVLTATPTAP